MNEETKMKIVVVVRVEGTRKMADEKERVAAVRLTAERACAMAERYATYDDMEIYAVLGGKHVLVKSTDVEQTLIERALVAQ